MYKPTTFRCPLAMFHPHSLSRLSFSINSPQNNDVILFCEISRGYETWIGLFSVKPPGILSRDDRTFPSLTGNTFCILAMLHHCRGQRLSRKGTNLQGFFSGAPFGLADSWAPPGFQTPSTTKLLLPAVSESRACRLQCEHRWLVSSPCLVAWSVACPSKRKRNKVALVLWDYRKRASAVSTPQFQSVFAIRQNSNIWYQLLSSKRVSLIWGARKIRPTM